jgi:hypothetical protein
LPETVIAEIKQPKLKFSGIDVLTRFANRVVLYIDPKFTDDDTENSLSDINIALNKVKDFGSRCNLTEEEFLLALDYASKGLLTIDEQKVKVYREINQINLSEIEYGYSDFKARNQKYQNGKNQIQSLLNPPPPKLTAEEYETLTLENIRKDFHRFKADGKVLATPIFYDLLKCDRGDKVKLVFVEKFLQNYVPETAEGRLSSEGSALPKVIKKDAYVEFQNEMIRNYVIYLKLNETSEEIWMQHWKNLLQKKN